MQMHVNLQAIIISNCVNSVYLTADTAFHNSFTDVFFFFFFFFLIYIYICAYLILEAGAGSTQGVHFFFLNLN